MHVTLKFCHYNSFVFSLHNLELNADNVLYLLKKHKFSPAVWEKLAVGLKLSSAVDVIDKDKHDCDTKLIALVNLWVDNDPYKSWDMLVSAIKMSDKKVVADNLAREVGLHVDKKKTCNIS